jgi:hypothetical protein
MVTPKTSAAASAGALLKTRRYIRKSMRWRRRSAPTSMGGGCTRRWFVCPVVVGSGKRFFPEGVRLDLEVLKERRFARGVVILRYGVRGAAGGLDWA